MMRRSRLAATLVLVGAFALPLSTRGQNAGIEAGSRTGEEAPSTAAPSRAQVPVPPGGREPGRHPESAGRGGTTEKAEPDVVRGIFGVPDHEMLSLVDAFAWEDEGESGLGRVLRVRLSDRPLDRTALDAAIDFEHELARQTAEGSAWAELEVDPETGAWLGSSFLLPDGWGCGWCGADEAERKGARLRIDSGRLRGRLDVEPLAEAVGTGVEIELRIDVPISRLEGVEALPAGGGEPARALEVCRAAVRGGHRDGIRSFCFAVGDRQLASAERVVEEAWADVALFDRDSLRAARLVVLDGRIKGDRALLRVETGGAEGRQRGDVFLVRTPSGWRFEAERLHPIWDD